MTVTELRQGFTGQALLEHLEKWQTPEMWQHPTIPPPKLALYDGRHSIAMAELHYTTSGALTAGEQKTHTVWIGMDTDGRTLNFAHYLTSTPYRDWLSNYLTHDALCKRANKIAKTDQEQAWLFRLYGDRVFLESLEFTDNLFPPTGRLSVLRRYQAKCRRGLLYRSVRVVGSKVGRTP